MNTSSMIQQCPWQFVLCKEAWFPLFIHICSPFQDKDGQAIIIALKPICKGEEVIHLRNFCHYSSLQLIKNYPKWKLYVSFYVERFPNPICRFLIKHHLTFSSIFRLQFHMQMRTFHSRRGRHYLLIMVSNASVPSAQEKSNNQQIAYTQKSHDTCTILPLKEH